MSSLSPNAQIVSNIFDEVAKGNGAPFWDACHDDVVWRTIGEGSWSGEFSGKQTIIDEIFRPLNRVLVERATIPTRLIDGGDIIVLQARGRNLTHDGQRYDNDYVFVIHFENGKIIRYEEYCDTELIARVLPDRVAAKSIARIEDKVGDEHTPSGRSYRLLSPSPSQRLGGWAIAFPAYEEIVGYSFLGHFFMRNPTTGDYIVLHPFRAAAKSYGHHHSIEDFQRDVLDEPGFSSYVLRVEHVATIRQLLGAPGENEIYIPAPYPFLGGTEEPETYSKGDVWVFMNMIAQMHGLDA